MRLRCSPWAKDPVRLPVGAVALLLVIFSSHCVRNPQGSLEPPRSGRALAQDGVPIAYTIQGGGATTLVFVHGWACDRTYWSEQLPRFAGTHRVVALDLAGHGESGTDRTEWTVRRLADDVVAVLEAEDLRNVVLIGHSMGAPVSLLAAQTAPGRIEAIVAVDALHDAERSSEEELRSFIAAVEADFQGTLRTSVPRYLFRPDADPDLVTRVASDMSQAPAEIAIPLLRSLATFDLRRALARVEVPIRCINSTATNIEGNRKYARDFDAVLMEGVGHFPMLEQPQAFNSLLERVLSELEGA